MKKHFRMIGVLAVLLPLVPAVNGNEYWSPKQALRHLSAYEEEYDLFWVEEPARRWDYKGLRQIDEIAGRGGQQFAVVGETGVSRDAQRLAHALSFLTVTTFAPRRVNL